MLLIRPVFCQNSSSRHLPDLMWIRPDHLHQLADRRAEADAICSAEYGVCSEARRNARNGYQHRDFDARTGSLNVAIPMVRQGTCFLDRRIRAECASHS
jgi:hypothetical protein